MLMMPIMNKKSMKMRSVVNKTLFLLSELNFNIVMPPARNGQNKTFIDFGVPMTP